MPDPGEHKGADMGDDEKTGSAALAKVWSSLIHIVASVQVIPAIGALVSALIVGLWRGHWRDSAVLAGIGSAVLIAAFAIRRLGSRQYQSVVAVNSAGVAAGWVVGTVVVAAPMFAIAWLSDDVNPTIAALRSPLDAWYEGTSSLSSSGLTIANRSSELPEAIQVWRSVCQWIGGVGLAVFALLVMKPAEQGSTLYSAETRRWTVEGSVRSTVNHVLLLYSGITLFCGIGFAILGMDSWEAVNHSLIIASTGGLTVTNDSFTGYSSSIQVVACIGMILAAVSFGTLFLMATGSIRKLWRRTDLRALVVYLLTMIAVFVALAEAFGSQEKNQSVFNLVSAVSTCGVSSGTLADFAVPTIWLLIIAMFIGGCGDSTAGGVKIDRSLWTIKVIRSQLRSDLAEGDDECPAPEWNGKTVERKEARQRSHRTLVMLALFLATAATGYLLLRMNYEESIRSDRVLFQAISALGAVGLSMDLTGPDRPALAKLVEILLMLLGRLEIVALLLLPPVIFGKIRLSRGESDPGS